MRKLARLLLFALIPFAVASVAQATPFVSTASQHDVMDVNRLDAVLPAKLDLLKVGEEDVAREQQGLPPRFAIPQKVSITPDRRGTWEDLGNGQMFWRLRILGREGTTSLNLGFTRFKMTPNARVLLYSTDGTQSLRPFTAADNEKHGELWTPVILTNDLIVELTVPRRERQNVELTIGSINQGYRGFGTLSADDYNKSGSCNLDVACLATGDTWREEMRAVGVISTGGSTFCTGSLVNDTAGDRKMYFMTANHCSINSGNAASLVVYWNYQNSFCRTPGSAASGTAGDGTLAQFHTGSFFRAANAASDFTLVELDDPPVTAYNHFWAGWDRSTGSHACSAASPCASIHHPSTDEKRITYVTSQMDSTSYSGTTSPGDGTHLWAKWATDPPGPYHRSRRDRARLLRLAALQQRRPLRRPAPRRTVLLRCHGQQPVGLLRALQRLLDGRRHQQHPPLELARRRQHRRHDHQRPRQRWTVHAAFGSHGPLGLRLLGDADQPLVERRRGRQLVLDPALHHQRRPLRLRGKLGFDVLLEHGPHLQHDLLLRGDGVERELQLRATRPRRRRRPRPARSATTFRTWSPTTPPALPRSSREPATRSPGPSSTTRRTSRTTTSASACRREPR